MIQLTLVALSHSDTLDTSVLTSAGLLHHKSGIVLASLWRGDSVISSPPLQLCDSLDLLQCLILYPLRDGYPTRCDSLVYLL